MDIPFSQINDSITFTRGGSGAGAPWHVKVDGEHVGSAVLRPDGWRAMRSGESLHGAACGGGLADTLMAIVAASKTAPEAPVKPREVPGRPLVVWRAKRARGIAHGRKSCGQGGGARTIPEVAAEGSVPLCKRCGHLAVEADLASVAAAAADYQAKLKATFDDPGDRRSSNARASMLRSLASISRQRGDAPQS